ncbi:MAG: indole-3-glycerol-phosphate synthase [Gemmatimonadales bacterium]
MPNSKIIRTTPETQANFAWVFPSGTLGELTAAAWARSEVLEQKRESVGLAPDQGLIRPSFAEALRRANVAVIAEMKRRSPSKGEINSALGSAEQASKYAAGGAAALSVLTEPTRFGGRNDDIGKARVSGLPILKKDFHVSEAQLAEAVALGASAALIIVRAISPDRLPVLAQAAREIDLEVLFEVRDQLELNRALEAGATMIGVNNRNLETLLIDPDTVSRIIPLVPSECIAIAESGYSTAADVQRAADAGADAVLIGSSLSASPDPRAAVTLLSGVARRQRS